MPRKISRSIVIESRQAVQKHIHVFPITEYRTLGSIQWPGYDPLIFHVPNRPQFFNDHLILVFIGWVRIPNNPGGQGRRKPDSSQYRYQENSGTSKQTAQHTG